MKVMVSSHTVCASVRSSRTQHTMRKQRKLSIHNVDEPPLWVLINQCVQSEARNSDLSFDSTARWLET